MPSDLYDYLDREPSVLCAYYFRADKPFLIIFVNDVDRLTEIFYEVQARADCLFQIYTDKEDFCSMLSIYVKLFYYYYIDKTVS